MGHTLWTQKSLCVLKEIGVNTTLFDWYTHRYLCVTAGFLLCKAVSRVLF